MVFYRKYRSQKIDELDSKRVRETLVSVLSKEPAHAFLFTGPKGLGKTSTARIVAKAVNCLAKQDASSLDKKSKVKNTSSTDGKSVSESGARKDIEPCNECEQCRSIMDGTNMDVIEIDAASNRGIDEMRDLREKIWLAPLKAKKKVYIIDEVHMLTTEAFNALLKTLEEPPEHAMFILCTTEPQKIPATILSRCFHIVFEKANEEEIARSLRRIVKGEGIEVDREVLLSIGRMADGGFRDAVKMLEEVSILTGKEKITKALFEKVYKPASVYLNVENLLRLLKDKDAKGCLELVAKLVNEGIDIKFFISQVLLELHNLLLIEVGVVKMEEEKNGGSKRIGVEEIRRLADILGRAYQEMRMAVLPQLPLELAIVEYLNSGEDKAVVEGDRDSRREASETEDDADKKMSEEKLGPTTVSGLRKKIGAELKAQVLNGGPKPNEKQVKVKATSDVELLKVPADGELTDEWLAAFWKGLIAEMKQFNHTVAGVLRSCRINSFDKKELVIGTGYVFHKERLDDMKARDALKSVCKVLTGKDVEVKIELNGRG